MIPASSWADQGNGTAWLAFPVSLRMSDWKLADHPCDTCDGKQWYDCGRCRPPCPQDCDCINGRHTFTIDVVEAVCYWCDEDNPPNQSDSAQEPGDCLPEHEVRSLRVSVVPDMVLPIADGNLSALLERGPCIGFDDYGVPHLFAPNKPPVPITLGSDAKPGGFAVLINWQPHIEDLH